MEDSKVRSAALNALRYLCKSVFLEVAPVFPRLGTSQLLYAKISCCNLISYSLKDRSFELELFPHCSKIISILLHDPNLLVRRASAEALLELWKIKTWNPSSINQLTQNEDSNETAQESVFSLGFLSTVQDLLSNLINNDLACEMLDKEFLKVFFSLLSDESKIKIKIDLLVQFVRFLELKSQEPNQESRAWNMEPVEVVSDQFWKMRYMFSQNLSIIVDGIDPFSFEISSKITDLFENNSILANSVTITSSHQNKQKENQKEIDSKNKDAQTNNNEENQIKQENSKEKYSLENLVNKGESLLPILIYGIYKQYISLESFEIRSMFFSSLVNIMKDLSIHTKTNLTWDIDQYQIQFSKKVIKIVNEFILFDQSFYVKMRVSHFLVEIMRIALKNQKLDFEEPNANQIKELTENLNTFSSLEFSYKPDAAFEPNMLPQTGNNKIETKKENEIVHQTEPFGMSIMIKKKPLINDEPNPGMTMDAFPSPNVDEITVKSTKSILSILNTTNLIKYCFNVSEALSLDSNIEIYREKFFFIKNIFILSSKYPKKFGWLRDKMLEGAQKAHQNPNLKYREEFLSQIQWVIENCRVISNSETEEVKIEKYIYQSLLPLKPPKNRKTERDLISLTNRTNEQSRGTSREIDQKEEEELQIKFALANMFQGYLSAIPKLGQRKERKRRAPVSDFESIL